jgi:hypothetical protein
MTLNRKQIAGIAAVAVAAAYSLVRWRGTADDPGEQAATPE